ncbi:hypothetical protein PVAP13_6NG159800 [Panicum virgatum]|uniref:Uncharacterized protein n=1 Tax=Panicum virgatum TaxID=38727 RepID=A0A8T0QZ08_PANVG|nr:hypothetical protein PVAP13_6NG159800 [Panicum virgatum]
MSCVCGRNGESSMPCACAGIMRLHLQTRPHLCRMLIKRGKDKRKEGGSSRNPQQRRGASVQQSPYLGPAAPIPPVVTNPVCLRLHPGALLQRPLHLFVLPWSAISTQNKPSLLSSLMMWIQLSLLCGFQPCAGRWRSLALLKERIALDKLLTRRLDPIELVVWLPALCRKMEVPYCLFTHYNASMPDRHL